MQIYRKYCELFEFRLNTERERTGSGQYSRLVRTDCSRSWRLRTVGRPPLPPEPRGCAVRPPLRRQDPGTPLDSWIRVGRNGHKTDSNRENAGRPRLTSEAGMPPAGSITSRATAAASYPSGCPCDGSLTGFHHDLRALRHQEHDPGHVGAVALQLVHVLRHVFRRQGDSGEMLAQLDDARRSGEPFAEGFARSGIVGSLG
ncbi:unnamed protein product [Nesidiocoris tenuis]|uniref:Uncharacterized protein n=1 Tax=Nesidiocoris tenuis TaxID=355587 RepID=A0A6H5G2R7_9HEMI|nr:unnamed protein product [Nesidiocoris tenuis]